MGYKRVSSILNKEQEKQFQEWMEDGNVIEFEDGYSTQDAQYRNRLKDLDALRLYFYNEFIKGQYAVGGNVLLAPNGKPSKLTPEQYKLVRLPEFKAWFGDWENDPANASKVVDVNGEPLVCYHTTDYLGDINIFKFSEEYNFQQYGYGVYFTDDKKHSEDYFEGENYKVYEVFLNLKNPIIRNEKEKGNTKKYFLINREENNKAGAIIYHPDRRKWNYFIAGEPNQIKLADGTNTTFDGKNPDIRYAGGGRTMENIAKKQARKDIKTDLYRPQAPYQSIEKPSEEWERYELPYDTKMQYDFEPDSFSAEGKRYSEYATGGKVGDLIKFKNLEKEVLVGRINNVLGENRYSVSSGFGSFLVDKSNYVGEVETPAPRKKFLGIFADGGEIKVNGMTKMDYVNAYDKRVAKAIRDAKKEGVYLTESNESAFDSWEYIEEGSGFKANELVGWWIDFPNYFSEWLSNSWYGELTKLDIEVTKILGEFYFGKPMFINISINTGGDLQLAFEEELNKIKLLSNKIDFDEVKGDIDYDKKKGNTNLYFYKNGKLVMSLKGDWIGDTEELDTIIDINGETTELNYHPFDSMGGLDLTELQENIDNAFRELNTYSAVVSIEGYEEYAEDVEGLENARAVIQDIKGNTRFQVLKGSSVGVGKLVDVSRVVEEFANGGEATFDEAGSSMVMYHEKKGNFMIPKGQIYLYLYDVEKSGEKLQNGEFDWVFYPFSSISLASQSGFIPPLKKIWTKKFQKEHKGSEHLLGVIKAFLIDKDNGEKELYIDMMSVNPTNKKKGIMSYMIKDLRDAFNLSQDQVTFSQLTEEGKKFVAKKTYDDGGAIYPDLSLEKSQVVNDSIELVEFQIKKSKNIFTKNGIENIKITSSSDAVDVLKKLFEKDTMSAYEQAFILYLNKNNKIIGYYHHSSGGIDGTVMDIQMISGMALKSLAKGVIISHNHPSENTKPSDADKKITEQLNEALKLFNVKLLDSIILTENSYLSFQDEGMI